MKLTEIVQAIKDLQAKVSDFAAGKVKATTEALDQMRADFSALESTVRKDLESALASIADLTAKLTKATEEVNARDTQLAALTAALDKALIGFALKPESFESGTAKIEAIAHHVTTALAAAGVDPKVIPAASAETKKTAKELQAEYRSLLAAGKGVEAAAFWSRNVARMFD
jgi:chromosome segregation ATPase